MTQTGDLSIIDSGDAETASPARGTLAWLQLQEHIPWEGQEIPACHRIPEGASRYDGEDDGKCRVVRPVGGRCAGVRTRLYGVCAAHLGGGDPQAASKKGNAARARLRARRSLLGIGANRAANPRQIARVRALERAEEIADALVDGVLDATDIDAVGRQLAVIRALDATFPIQTATLEVEVPADAAGVAALGWVEMQQLAASMLGDGVPTGYQDIEK